MNERCVFQTTCLSQVLRCKDVRGMQERSSLKRAAVKPRSPTTEVLYDQATAWRVVAENSSIEMLKLARYLLLVLTAVVLISFSEGTPRPPCT